MVNLLSNSIKASKQDFKLDTMRNKLRQTHIEPEKKMIEKHQTVFLIIKAILKSDSLSKPHKFGV